MATQPTALELVANFKNVTTTPETPIKTSRNIVYLCNHIDESATTGYVKITNADDIATYTTDPRPKGFFDEGMTQIYLLFGNLTDTTIMDTAFAQVQNFAASLMVGLNATNPFNLNDFAGVKFNQSQDLSLLVDTTERLSDKPFYSTILTQDADTSLTMPSIIGRFLQSTNTLWSNLEYAQFPKETSLLTLGTDAQQARKNHLSFLYNDTSTITTPSLFYLQAGKISLSDYYITLDILQEIQLRTFEIIQRNSLPGSRFSYTDDNIVILEEAGLKVLDQYKNIGSRIRGGSYTLPGVSSQPKENITTGLVAGAKLVIKQADNIWYMEGTINALGDGSEIGGVTFSSKIQIKKSVQQKGRN